MRKKPFSTFLVIAFVASCSISAAQNAANLTISTTGTTNLKVQLNGQRYSLQDRSATFQNITPGQFPLIIYQWQTGPDGNASYREVYNGNITLTAGRHLEVAVLRFGKVQWDEGARSNDTWADATWNMQGVAGNSTTGNAISADQFKKMKEVINNAFYDEKKLEMAKVVMKNNLFTANQVKSLCDVLYAEKLKLDLVIYAYDLCVNKGDYYIMADLFWSENNKTAFIDFLKSK